MSHDLEQKAAAGSHLELETTDVPSTQQTQADPASTLAWIQTRINKIYSATKHLEPDKQSVTIPAGAYAAIYGAVFNYCTVTKAKPHKGDLNGEDLYYSLEREIRTYCSDIRHEIFTNQTQDTEKDTAERVLRGYMIQWDRFVKLARLVRNLLQFLERHWIRREIELKVKDRYMIEDLHKRLWKEETLQIKKDEPSSPELQALTDATIMLREKATGITAEETDLVQSVVSSLSSIDLVIDVHVEPTSERLS